MKFSTRSRYGVRAMYELAINNSTGPMPLKSIAKNQSLSEHYLEQLMSSLRKGGLVNSIRGAQGGYILAKTPENINIGDIIRILEGPIAPVNCVSEDGNNDCDNIDNCATRCLWKNIQEKVVEVLDSTTLASLVNKE
ncbi:transcriptional regulator, BadM/Rrf2 family [Desulfonispora thiosulfatigenes DSM 11270]|uniref:Transcriptional regulator, BadM/Rrf2 family n=1 Tax=Desulfonispora thiosulfatigenes DSM 11270 TaxID=656914 RepID=A0A1W1VQY8_DESTI|nr:Rrf2 family transcriptional regulator [Desulfonispora thiosulfatigenes]SMB95640.1 transcriptional regulator, BadM/Rrf2 family [Desulfonispora thiosulfatigenes DSM 11270]